jgi:hypothetical protein
MTIATTEPLNATSTRSERAATTNLIIRTSGVFPEVSFKPLLNRKVAARRLIEEE